jgi:hypothetical protein
MTPRFRAEEVKLGHGKAGSSTAIREQAWQRGHRLKSSFPIMAALLFQAGTFPSISTAPAPLAEPQHLRYVRSLTLPHGASGIACTILDASVYAHTASSSADDLRVFRVEDHENPQEIPFVVSYSAAQPTDAQTATVRNLTLHNTDLVFDLDMPQRAYTQVDLQLAATVSGSNGKGGPAKPLGVFTLFDLTQRHLARSTSLALQESTFPQLHITLHLRGLDGIPFPHLAPSIVQGATVPASREAQTLYTVVATTSSITQRGASSLAQLNIAAHIPIERVQFELDPTYKSDFLRNVSVVADADTKQSDQPQEVIDGKIWRVTRPSAAGAPAISAAKLEFTAVIASNLHDPANILVKVGNEGQPPLPIRAVQLEMRQRTLCFNATPDSTYTLRYGDNDLRASVYDLGDLATLPAKPLMANLGLEELNPGYIQRHVASTYDERNPDLFWIALLAAIAVLGTFVSRHTMRQGRRR